MTDEQQPETEAPESLTDIIAAARSHAPVLSDAELAKHAAEHEQREQRRKERQHQKDWERMIPPRYQWAHPKAAELASRAFPMRRTADGSGWERISVQATLARLYAHGGNLVVVGNAGDGKTSLACAALRAQFDLRPRDIGFASAHRLGVVRIQTAAGQGEARDVERAMKARLLLLDDLGNERQTANNAVPDVIFQRHEQGLQTWVTTGLGREDIAKLYGAGVARRVFEHALVIKCERPEGA